MTQPVLEAKHLTKSYDAGRIDALQDVDLRVEPGEFLAICGPSGSGKSTLLHLLGGLDTPSRGEVLYRGTELSALGSLDDYRARRVGFVFQAFHLLPTLTAEQNVQIPMFETRVGRRERADRAQALLARVGLAHRMRQYPNRLSMGERQRVAIARSLANGPEILLADEPTGNLDSHTTNVVLDLLQSLRQERQTTLLLVTHEQIVAARAQRIVHIRDGRILE
jgi:ABC-type lipoprotein export system ATPase subunit